MRVPVRHLAGNVVWAVHGTVWGIWRIEGTDQRQGSSKTDRLAALEGLVKQLPGEAMLLSLCPQIDPATVVEQMTAGIDLEASERYTELAHRVLDGLEELELTGRSDWLAVPLPTPRREALGEAWRAAQAQIAAQLGLLPKPVPAGEEERRLEQARSLSEGWSAGVRLRPAREAEILWIYGHSSRRGLMEPLLPQRSDAARSRGRGRGMAAVGQAVLREGGYRAADQQEQARAGSWLRSLAVKRASEAGRSPFGRRWLEVATEWGESYQCLLGLAEMPEEFTFPGSGEYLAALDQFDFPVDWTVRLAVTEGATAEAKSRQQAREIANQYSEYEGETSGVPASTDKAATGLDEYRERLTSSAAEVEVQAMVALCVWGDSPDQAQARARELIGHFARSDYTFARPRGEQESLWYGMLPGARTPRVMTQYRQILLARDFAMSGPLAGAELGDGRGPLCGLQTAGGGVRPVLTDWQLAPARQASASAAFLGELGSGKSVAMKSAVYNILAAGRRRRSPGSRGRAVIVDRTRSQEWVRFAQACPGQTQVVRIDAEAGVSLDPLRIFQQRDAGGALSEAQRFTESYLTLLLGLAPLEDEGVALSEAIEEVLASPEPSMRRLQEHLASRGESDAASKTVARRLAAVARKDLARVIFDDELPVVEVGSADAVVFSVASLALPTRAETAGGRLEKLEFEKVFGRAVMYLVAALCRRIAFDDAHTSEFTVAVWDECWWLTGSPEGLDLLLELVRDGRKHHAGVLVGSHDAADIGPEDSEVGAVIRGLIPRRFLFRHTDARLARRGLAFLGLDTGDEDLVAKVTTGLSPVQDSAEEQAARAGECLHRDLLGRLGGMRILIPLDEEVAAQIHSDPVPAA